MCVCVGIRVGIVKVRKQKNSPSPESSVVRRSTKGLTDVQFSSGTRGQWPPSIGDSKSGKGGRWMDGRTVPRHMAGFLPVGMTYGKQRGPSRVDRQGVATGDSNERTIVVSLPAEMSNGKLESNPATGASQHRAARKGATDHPLLRRAARLLQ